MYSFMCALMETGPWGRHTVHVVVHSKEGSSACMQHSSSLEVFGPKAGVLRLCKSHVRHPIVRLCDVGD